MVRHRFKHLIYIKSTQSKFFWFIESKYHAENVIKVKRQMILPETLQSETDLICLSRIKKVY